MELGRVLPKAMPLSWDWLLSQGTYFFWDPPVGPTGNASPGSERKWLTAGDHRGAEPGKNSPMEGLSGRPGPGLWVPISMTHFGQSYNIQAPVCSRKANVRLPLSSIPAMAGRWTLISICMKSGWGWLERGHLMHFLSEAWLSWWNGSVWVGRTMVAREDGQSHKGGLSVDATVEVVPTPSLFGKNKWSVPMLSHLVMSDSLQPHGLQRARLLCPWGFFRQEYRSGLPCPLPGVIFPPQRPNPGLPYCRWTLYCLSHQGSPRTSGTSGEKEINTGCCSPCGHETLQLSMIIHPMAEEPKYQRSWRTSPFK